MELTNIYLMRDDHTRLYKIGRSVNPFFREKTLLSQAPATQLLCYWKDCAPSMETELHARHKQWRRRGEWFELTDEHLVYILEWMFDSFMDREDVHVDMLSIRARAMELTFRSRAQSAYNRRACDYTTDGTGFERGYSRHPADMEFVNEFVGNRVHPFKGKECFCIACRVFGNRRYWKVEDAQGNYLPGGNDLGYSSWSFPEVDATGLTSEVMKGDGDENRCPWLSQYFA